MKGALHLRSRFEAAIRRLWRDGGGARGGALSAALVPAELLYRTGVAMRNAAYDRGWRRAHRAAVPIVSVGNLAVGGTGKTPVAAWIARLLADEDRAPAVVSRGYGRDELRLHRRWNPDVPVFAHTDRRRAAEEAAESGCRSVVLDDGFQHRRLARGFDLVLLAVEEPGTSRLLPRGPWREPLSALRRADHVGLVRRTGESAEADALERRVRRRFPELPVARLRLAPNGWTTPGGAAVSPPTGPLLAVTGIARPRLFARLVRRLTRSEVELLAFPDHHPFGPADLETIRKRAGARPVITTEKDAARLSDPAAFGERARVLRLRVEIERGGSALRKALLDATRLATERPAGARLRGTGSGAAGPAPEAGRP